MYHKDTKNTKKKQPICPRLLYGQPYHVWYGFVLSAVVLLFVFPTVYFGAVRPVYKQAELRKMLALDA